ncbi:hypothetical protein PAHAL_6G225200 [Panicum hallii]|uniref:Uncharacterized protein n=1 Tax=Panicum hallii TaxID=206008 RepID=A0A2T8IH71_9POAL|nr:hypothetical protein PAHAL_6G225200 [Panicum hallii]
MLAVWSRSSRWHVELGAFMDLFLTGYSGVHPQGKKTLSNLFWFVVLCSLFSRGLVDLVVMCGEIWLGCHCCLCGRC